MPTPSYSHIYPYVPFSQKVQLAANSMRFFIDNVYGSCKIKNMRSRSLAICLLVIFLALSDKAFAADTTPPAGTIIINNRSPNTDTIVVTLTLSAQDSGSGVSQMAFSNGGAVWSLPEKYTTRKTWTLAPGDGLKSVYVRYKDTAGNWSNPCFANITLDTQGPSITVTSPTEGEVISE